MTVIDDYLATVEEPEQGKLEEVRKIIKQVVPEAQEVITYGMPGFKYKGKYLISFAAFKDHMSIFPGAEPVEEYKDRMKDFKVSKGTIQFTLEHPIPDDLLKDILLLCKARIDK